MATPPLRRTANPRMYGELTVNTPGCVAFSLPCNAGTSVFPNSSVFPILPARAARG
jgi:hypothetical protein